MESKFKMNDIHRVPTTLVLLGTILIVSFGCSKKVEEVITDNTEEVENYYLTLPSIPTTEREALERGEITQEEIDSKSAKGEYPKFFTFSTIDDLPDDLRWENGMDLPDIGSPNAKKGGTANGWLQDFPRTLRRVGPDANSSFRSYILDDVSMLIARRHPNLTEVGPTGHQYFPGLAKEWAVDKKHKTVYVRLNPEARWSDGHPVTTDDFFFMFFFFQSSYIRAPWYNNWYTRNYTNITRFDDHTFSISIPEAKPDMNSRILELEPVPRHFFYEMGDDFPERYQWRFVPTTGPYVVRSEDIKKGRSITLTRIEDWWAEDNKFWRNRYNYDKIHLTVIRDIPKAFETFKRGDLDGFGLTLSEYWYDKLPDDDSAVQKGYIHKIVFYNEVPRPTYGLWMNSSNPFLENREIRVGINYATHWKLVIDKNFRGDAVRMRTTSDGFGEFTHPTLLARPFSVDKALEHFAKAGFIRRDPDGILVNEDGNRLSFALSTGYRSAENDLTVLKEEAAKAGLEFRVEILDSTTGWKKVQEKKHDIFFSAFNVGPEMYPRFWETYHSVNAYDRPFNMDGTINQDRKAKTQTNNLQVIANREIDWRIEAYRASEDAGEMKKLAFEMEELLHEDASFVPGYVRPFYRIGYWRWIRYPEDFNVKLSRSSGEYFLTWIEPGVKKTTLEAKKTGRTFPPVIKTYDQYKKK